MAASECQWFGVAMEMTSMFLSSTTLRMSCSYLGVSPWAFSALLHGAADDVGVGVADGRDDAVVLAGEAVDVLLAAAVDADDGDAQLAGGVAGLGFLLRLLGGEALPTAPAAASAASTAESLMKSRRLRKLIVTLLAGVPRLCQPCWDHGAVTAETAVAHGSMGEGENGACPHCTRLPAAVNHFFMILSAFATAGCQLFMAATAMTTPAMSRPSTMLTTM